jgi:hypothetical protein
MRSLVKRLGMRLPNNFLPKARVVFRLVTPVILIQVSQAAAINSLRMANALHDFHDRAPTLTSLLHIAQIVPIRIRCNSPDIVLMGIEQPS